MAWREHDPDDVAPELWDEAVHIDGTDELSDRLTPVAERYADHYGVTFEKAAYRVAGEAHDWWPHDRPRTMMWTTDVLNGLLFPENVSLVVEHVEGGWDRCDGWTDSLGLVDEASLGTLLLQIGPPKIGRTGTFPPEFLPELPDRRAEDVWNRVLDTDTVARHGPMKRAGRLLDVVREDIDEHGMTRDEAIRDVVRAYVDAVPSSVAVYDATNLNWYVYDTPHDERYAERWKDGIDVHSWLREIANVLLEWKLTEHAGDVDSFLDIFGY